MKKNLFIVFCGVDGSGKSTYAEAVFNYLKQKWIQVEYLHRHGYTLAPKSFGMSAANVTRWAKFFTWLWPLAFFDQWYTYLFIYRPKLYRQSIISDRYYYDKIARLWHYGIIGEWVARWMIRFLPHPDLIFILRTKAEIVYKRKAEFSLSEYEKLDKFYEKFARWLNIKAIDTAKDLENTTKIIINKVTKHL